MRRLSHKIEIVWPAALLYQFVILLVFIFLTTPASALDLNSFRAQHGPPALLSS